MEFDYEGSVFMSKYDEWIKRRTTYGNIHNKWSNNYVKYRNYPKWAERMLMVSSVLLFVPSLLFSGILLLNGLYKYAFFIIIGIVFYTYVVFKFFDILQMFQGKRYKRRDEWPIRNKRFIEDSTTLQYQALREQNQIVASYFQEHTEPLKEIVLYHSLEERIQYLEGIPAALGYINTIIEEKYPFLSKVTNITQLEEVIKLFSTDRFVDLHCLNRPNVYPEARDVELELFKKHNIDVTYIENISKYFNRHGVSKARNIIETFNKENAILNLGVKGEDKLQQALDMHSDEFKVLYNVRLQVNDQSIESDALVFSQTGIYLLEVKNFGSSGKYSITVASDGQWLKCLQNGKKEPMKDVTAQTNRHIAYQNKFLATHMPKLMLETKEIKIKPIIVIGNDNVIVSNNSPQKIVRTSQLYNLIINNDNIYSKQDIDKLYNLFKENSLPSQRFPYRDLIQEYKNLIDTLTLVFDLKLLFRRVRTDYYYVLEDNVPDNEYLLKNNLNIGVISNYSDCQLLSSERFIDYIENDVINMK